MVSRVLFGVGVRRWGLVFVAPLVLVVFLLVGSGVARADTLDQSQTSTDNAVPIGGPNNATPLSQAQTFTAGLTGALDRVDLDLNNFLGEETAPLTVEIRNTSGGAPGSSVLASASVPASSVSSSFGFVEVDFVSPAQVVSGTQYAIVAYTADTSMNAHYNWADSDQNPYSGGALWGSGSPPTTWVEASAGDVAFETYVETAGDLAAQLVSDSTGVGPGKALFDQASAIQTAVNDADTATACADISDYLDLVKAQTGKKLTTSQASTLTSDADNLAAALGC